MTKRHQFQIIEPAAMIAPRKAAKRLGFVLCLLSSAVAGAAAVYIATAMQPVNAGQDAAWSLVQTVGQDEYVKDHGLTRDDCIAEMYGPNGPRGGYACQVER